MSAFNAYYTDEIASAIGHVTWTEPYTYTNGVLGVTAVAPAFDRFAVGPPRLIGVVGMDFLVDKMEEVMGSGIAARAAVLDTLAARATSSCPPSNVSECNLQSLRRASGGSNAMCPGECTETLEVASIS